MSDNERLFVVFWQYQANYDAPRIVKARTPEEAFDSVYHFYAKTIHPDFHRYIIEIEDESKFMELNPVKEREEMLMNKFDETPETEEDFMQECYKMNGGSERVRLQEEGQEPCYTSSGE